MKVVPAVVSAVPQFPVPMPVVKLSWLGCGLKPQQPARVVLVDVLVDVEVDVLVELVVTGALVEVDVLVELVVTGALVEVDVLVELVVTGPVDVVVEDVRQGLCAQEPVPLEKAPGCLAQLSGVNCPHSSVPFSGMQQIALVGGPSGWAVTSVGTNATAASIASTMIA